MGRESREWSKSHQNYNIIILNPKMYDGEKKQFKDVMTAAERWTLKHVLYKIRDRYITRVDK